MPDVFFTLSKMLGEVSLAEGGRIGIGDHLKATLGRKTSDVDDVRIIHSLILCKKMINNMGLVVLFDVFFVLQSGLLYVHSPSASFVHDLQTRKAAT